MNEEREDAARPPSQADQPADGAAQDAEGAPDVPRRRRRRGGSPVGETLGGILAGFDQQVLRRQPPAHELVLKGTPVRGLAGDDPRDLEIVLPDRAAEAGVGAGEEGSGDAGGAGGAGGSGDRGARAGRGDRGGPPDPA